MEAGGLVFDASFDSGNCARVEHRGDHTYALWTTADCAGTEHRTNFRSWFHFGVRGAEAGTQLTFEVHNMNAQGTLFKHDMRPVWRALPSRPQWERVRTPVETCGTKAEDNFVLTFRHRVDDDASPADVLFFAFCYPHTYADCTARLDALDEIFRAAASATSAARTPTPPGAGASAGNLEPRVAAIDLSAPDPARPPADPTARLPGGARLLIGGATPSCAELVSAAAAVCCRHGLPIRRPSNVYYRRERLSSSVEGRRLDLLTISGTNGMTDEREGHVDGLFPEGGDRPHMFEGKQARARACLTSRATSHMWRYTLLHGVW